MLKLTCQTEEDINNAAGAICEQHLPAVYRYISCWIDNRQVAEELSLRVLRKALAGGENYCEQENRFSIEIFGAVRQEIRVLSKTCSLNPAWPDLSVQEREVMSLKLGAALDNRRISKILGLAESNISRIICRSLCKLSGG